MVFDVSLNRIRNLHQKIDFKDYFANVFIGLSLVNFLFIVFSKLYFARDLFIHFAWFPDDLPGIGLVNPPQGLGAGHFFGSFTDAGKDNIFSGHAGGQRAVHFAA